MERRKCRGFHPSLGKLFRGTAGGRRTNSPLPRGGNRGEGRRREERKEAAVGSKSLMYSYRGGVPTIREKEQIVGQFPRPGSLNWRTERVV